jgi:hypothetical protein
MRDPFEWSADVDSDDIFGAIARRTLADYGDLPASEWTLVESDEELEQLGDEADLEPAA